MNIFNFDTKKVGGIRFIKLGRFTLSFSVSSEYSPIGYKRAAERRLNRALDARMLSGPFYAELEAMADAWRAETMAADRDR